MFSSSVDHLDPLISNFVCGLDQKNNIRVISLELNKLKANAFVPYRVTAGEIPPMFEGQICWFLIEGEWVREPFCGKRWWKEATRIGYSRTNARGSSWYTDGVISRMIHPGEPIPSGFVEGRIYTGWGCSNPSPIKGKVRAYNPQTGQDGFFSEVPQGFVEGIPPHKRNPGKPREVTVRWTKEICDWYLLGFTTHQIGAILNLSANAINAILRKNSVPLRPRGGKRGKDLKPRKIDGYQRKQKPLDN